MQSPLSINYFNGVSFEWALTHRSFPRILPDSSNFPGAIPKFFSKFDVRMNFHQSDAFSKIAFKFFWSLIQPLYSSLSRSVSAIHGGVSRRHSQLLKSEEEFSSKSCSLFWRFMVLASCHPHNCFDCENSFHPSRAIQESFQFDSPEPSSRNYSFSAFGSRSSNLTGASLKYSLISSWSLCSLVSKSPQAYLFS